MSRQQSSRELSAQKPQALSPLSAPQGFFAAFRMTALATVFLSMCPLTGCRSTPPPKPLAELTPAEQVGRAAFAAHCGTCHYDRETGSLHGPSLLGVYKKPYLPSGAPANDERIRATILHGRGNMPALAGAVSEQQIDSILLYLRTL